MNELSIIISVAILIISWLVYGIVKLKSEVKNLQQEVDYWFKECLKQTWKDNE